MNHKIEVVKCPMQKRRSCWGNILLKPPKSKCNKASAQMMPESSRISLRNSTRKYVLNLGQSTNLLARIRYQVS